MLMVGMYVFVMCHNMFINAVCVYVAIIRYNLAFYV